MKNVTVSLDDESYVRAKRFAAERGRSLSSLVREFLNASASQETEAERRRRELDELFAEWDRLGIGLDPGENLSRDELYERAPAHSGRAAA